MQTQTVNLKPKKGPLQPGPGRPTGYLAPATVRKLAMKTLQAIMQNEAASPEARAIAACKLVDEIKI